MAAVVTGLSLPDSPEPPDPPDPPSTLTILATSVSIVVELSTLTYLDLKVTDLNLSNQIFKELPLSKDFGLMNQCRCHTTPYCSMQTFYHHHFNLWPWTASLSPSQTVVSLHLTRSTPSHAADSYCRFPPSLTASSSHHLSQTPDLFYSTFLLTFQECVLQIASQALEFRAAGSVDIIPSSLSLPLDQVMHLYLNSPIPIASSYFHKTYGGSLMSIATNASMFVLFKGSAFRCIVTSAFIADFRIDILAQCAVPISGVGLLSVADNPQLDFPLLSITEVECRGPLFIFSVLSFSSGFVVSFFEHLLLSWRVNLVWYYNNALGRPEKKKFIARKKSSQSAYKCGVMIFRLQVLHQNFDLPAPYICVAHRLPSLFPFSSSGRK
ncbi:unnamed protein product [Brassica oleracea]